MNSFREVMDALIAAMEPSGRAKTSGIRSGLRVFADEIGVTYNAAEVMRCRGSIHRRHWLAIEQAAPRWGYPQITSTLLLELAAERDKRRIAKSDQVAA